MNIKTLFLILFLLFPISGLYSKEYVFNVEKPKIGDAYNKSSLFDLSLNMDIYINGKKIKTSANSKQSVTKLTITILEIKNDTITKIKATYGINKEHEKEGDKEKNVIEPISGKTYIVDRNNESITITYEDGKIPPEDEIIKVQHDFKKDFKGDDISAFSLKGKTFKKGERVKDLETKLLNDVLKDNKDKYSINGLKISYEGERKVGKSDCGIFKISITVKTKEEEKISIEMKLEGEMLVTFSQSRPLKVNISGPITMYTAEEQDGNKMEIKGNGKMKVQFDYSY